jgi:pyruvate formate lyase activating enzyme
VAELVRQVERDRPFYEESGGGVTFSGGEPLLQSEFLTACLQELKRQGYHTAVDTCGFAPREAILEAAAWTDLFLYDLKFVDPGRHLKHTGVPVGPVLENLKALDGLGKTVWLRLPFVPGINDDAENLDAVGRFAATLESTRRLHLLPYHRFGAEKYRSLGREYPMGELSAPPSDALDAAARRLGSYGLEVHLGG